MKIGELLYFANRKDWRKWLEKYHNKKKEAWLLYYKKHTGKACIPYDDAVEEAICYGWIDSTVKRIDDEKHCQRYTPRSPKSIWSNINIKRAEKMIKEGLMTPAGMKLYEKKTPELEVDMRLLKMPVELKKELEKNKKAKKYYESLAPSYKKLYKWFIISAKREETRKKRVKKAVKNLEEHKKYAFME